MSSESHHSLMLNIVIIHTRNTVINVFIKKEKIIKPEPSLDWPSSSSSSSRGRNLNFTSSAGI